MSSLAGYATRFGPGLAPWVFVAIWSTGFVVAGGVIGRIDPHLFLSVRFALVAAILFIACFVLGKRQPPRAIIVRLMILGLFLQGLYLGPGYWVVANGMPVGVIALIATLQPPLTAIAASRMYGEKITPWLVVGLLLGIIGVGLAVAPGLVTFDQGQVTPLVLLVACLSITCFTIGTLLQKGAGLNDVPLVVSTAWQNLAAAICTGVFAAMLGEDLFTVSSESLFALFWAIGPLSLGATTLLIWMVRNGQATRVTSLMFLVAPLAAIEAWLLFGQSLSVFQLVGFLIALAGVLLARRS